MRLSVRSMCDQVSDQSDKGLTTSALNALLARLAEDLVAEGKPNDAQSVGEAYELLRRKLTEYFCARPQLAKYGVPSDVLADTVIDRLAKHLLNGKPIPVLMSFTYGIARLVGLEISNRHPEQEQEVAETGTTVSILEELLETENDAHRKKCLQGCLQTLPADEALQLVRYYQIPDAPEPQLYKHIRESLAQELGLSPVNLRSQVHRNKVKLLRCLRECLGKATSNKH